MIKTGPTQYDTDSQITSKDYWSDPNLWPQLNIENVSATPVPEPSSMVLGLIGMAGAWGARRLKNNKNS